MWMEAESFMKYQNGMIYFELWVYNKITEHCILYVKDHKMTEF